MGKINEIPITPDFRKALNKLLETEHGKAAEIGRAHNIPKDRLSKWSSGKIKSMTKEDYNNLPPYLKPYLPVPDRTGNSFSNVAVIEGSLEKKTDSEKEAVLIKNLSSTLEQLAPGHQIVTGVIYVGIPHEKIMNAILSSNLTTKQKLELQTKIFS